MARTIYVAIAWAIYLLFFATNLYLICFVGALPWVPRTVDSGPLVSTAVAVAIDVLLIGLFGFQHSGMARRGFKAGWTRVVPPALERSIYVLASCLVLIVLFVGWRPIPTVIWTAHGAVAIALWVLFGCGWLIALLSTFLINHFELFGLSQVWRHRARQPAAAGAFRTPLFYRVVRHPLYTGFVIALWATPVMTAGHLLLAAGLTVYVLVAIVFEERDLVAAFGDDYRRYKRSTGMLVPRPRRTKA